ncbi:hypothetical protein ACFL3G_10685 [Planctomycetota bacterium]
MDTEMIDIPSMIMVGAAERNVGKTEFVCSLIGKFGSQHKIVGIKVTPIELPEADSLCGEKGSGVCSADGDNFCITQETDVRSDKDTCKMLASGASKVFWVRALKGHLKQALVALQELIDEDAVSVCESNSLREIVVPGLFFMLKARAGGSGSRVSARKVSPYVDRMVGFDGSNFDIDLDQIELVKGRWVYKMDAMKDHR